MKHKIYIVHESIGIMGEIQQRMVKAFACKHTARKFIDYQNLKLAALKARFSEEDILKLVTSHSKTATIKLRRLTSIYSTQEYFVKEIDLHH